MIKLVIYCDKPGCDVSQEVFFGKLNETFEDLINHIRSNGWTVEGGQKQETFECTCMYEHEE